MQIKKKKFFEIRRNKKYEEQQSQEKGKKAINLLIAIERNGKEQFDDTIHNAWNIFQISTLADIEQIKILNSLYTYKCCYCSSWKQIFSK